MSALRGVCLLTVMGLGFIAGSARAEDFEAVDKITRQYLPDRGFINSAFLTKLLNPNMLIEIEATALLN